MRTRLLALAVVTGVLSTGCASLTNNTVQPVIVKTTCGDVQVRGAQCRIINPHGSWVVTTPSSVMITKAPGDMAVDCKMPGAVADPVLYESHATLGAWGNLIIGGAPGFAFDAYRDAAWGYHPEMSIDICRGQSPETVKSIQSAVAAVNGGIAATPDNTRPLSNMQSLLGGERKYSVAAETVAKQNQCTRTPVAVLTARGPATEVYTVPCNSGDSMMLKCTWGECKTI